MIYYTINSRVPRAPGWRSAAKPCSLRGRTKVTPSSASTTFWSTKNRCPGLSAEAVGSAPSSGRARSGTPDIT